jgi:hypothetical protein
MVNLQLLPLSILIRTRTLRHLWRQCQLSETLSHHVDAHAHAALVLVATIMEVIEALPIAGGHLLLLGDPHMPQL